MSRGVVDDEGEPTYDPDELSAEGTAEVDSEGEWEDSPTASPASADVSDRYSKVKPRKRLVRKSVAEDSSEPYDLGEEQSRVSKRKSKDTEEREWRKKARKARDGQDVKDRDGRGEGSKKGKVVSTPSKPSKLARSGGGSRSDRAEGSERLSRLRDRREEKWEDPDAAQDSEEDKEADPTPDDENFIDDRGAERYSDDEGGYTAASPSHAPEAEEEDATDELNNFFKSNKKKISNERTSEEIAMFVEQFMAKLDVAAESDADLNRASKPAIEKLKMLPELLHVLEKRQLQQEFLDRGVLSSLKNWLEPLPDGSLPNMNIRSALLKLLTDLPIDVEVFERREQLKKSGLGKVVMFLSRLSEETPVNKKLARDLVDKWSRPIFQKSTRYEDLKQYDDERPPPRRMPVKKPVPKPRVEESRGGDELELEIDPERELKPGDPGYRYHASRPQALPLDFVIRPASKVDAESVKAQAKHQRMEEKRSKMNKKLQQLRTPKKKNLQAARLSVEGRGLMKFF
ncbi:unnamed protein product [Calypogeia fissa]